MTYEFTIRGLDQCGLEATDLDVGKAIAVAEGQGCQYECR